MRCLAPAQNLPERRHWQTIRLPARWCRCAPPSWCRPASPWPAQAATALREWLWPDSVGRMGHSCVSVFSFFVVPICFCDFVCKVTSCCLTIQAKKIRNCLVPDFFLHSPKAEEGCYCQAVFHNKT